jgi:hypothetical protein
MQQSTSKLLRSLSLARAGLAPALVILLLGATAPRLAAQSDNFDLDGNAPGYPGTNAAPGWATYSLDSLSTSGFGGYYPTTTFSFPANPAGPGGNYAYEIYAAPITVDPFSYGPPRAGSFRTDRQYGSLEDGSNGRFFVGTDIVAWNTNSGNWTEQLFGVCWYASDTNVTTTKCYLGGWGPNLGTVGLTAMDLSQLLAGGGGNPLNAIKIIAVAGPENTIELDPTHQYRMEASSHDGETFLLRLFDLVDTNNPWISCIADDTTYNNTPGYSGIVEANYDFPPTTVGGSGNSTAGVDVTYDNYVAYLPPANTMPAIVTDLSPQPGGNATTPVVTVGILNRDTTVIQSTILLYLDGVLIPSASRYLTIDQNWVYKPFNTIGGLDVPTNFPGATVTYVMTNQFAFGSQHTTSIVFRDYLGGPHNWFTNIWSWTSQIPQPLNAALSVRGFATRTVVSSAANLGGNNSIAGAEAVLNYQYPVDLASTNICQSVNWGIYGTEYGGTVTNFPGLCIGPTAYPNSFAVEVMAYLQLPAGTNVFWVAHDDAVAIYSGQSPTDTSVLLLQNTGSDNGVDSGETFNWSVLTAGLYPIHIIFEEGGGAAYLILRSTNNTGPVVGAAGGIPAFYPPPSWDCMSSTVVRSNSNYNTPVAATLTALASGPITTAAAPPCDGTNVVLNQVVTGWSGTNTITFAAPSSATYYRLYGPGSTKILSCQKSGTNLVLTYRWQNP